MKDLFSGHSKDYAKFRPSYPEELFDFLLENVNGRIRAWDCGTGNGQVAVKLAESFEEVYATDLSENQLKNAIKRDNIRYMAMNAEDAEFEEGLKFDLITVAQAVHWFDFKQFYKRVDKYLHEDGLIALIGYDVVEVNQEVDKVIDTLYSDIIGEYWDAERRYVDEHYKNIPFPFEDISASVFRQKVSWSMEQLIGYLNTWSGVKHYIKKHKQNPVDKIGKRLQKAWGNETEKEISFPVFLRMGQ